MKNILVSIVAIASSILPAYSITVEQAKALYNQGEYSKAIVELKKQVTKTPSNASLNFWLGACLYEENKIDQAIPYLVVAEKKGVVDSYYYLALVNYKKQDLKNAIKYNNLYRSEISKNKRAVPPMHEEQLSIISKSKIMLEHVENIEVIDSVIVDKESFFKSYKISPEVGSFKSKDFIADISSNAISPIFIPESKQRMMWSDKGEGDNLVLMETTKLIDDTWDAPHQLKGNWSDGDTSYPYLMPDGTTLYFASTGIESLGGYDIFITRKDADTGEYLQPQNIGMPYNSPYDDYLLVIDEFTGAGWWATDRNNIPGKVTIYIFKPSEVRKNYSIEDPKIMSYAGLSRIKDTWVNGADYAKLKEKINNIDNKKKKFDKDFEFILSNGKIYTNINDFKSQEAKNLVYKWSQEVTELKSKRIELLKNRAEFSSNQNNASLRSAILRLENDIERLSSDIEKTANFIRRAELNN